jgi:two-component system alkaline phosphatase synthesis response regulator PhoP
MRKKLLVVDDDLDLLNLLRLHFKEEGFAVTVVSNGLEAVKKARQMMPDLILLDLVLPGLDGFEVCESLRQSPATANTPIILVSGASSELSRLAAMEAGGTAFVSKPVSPGELVTLMRQHLSPKHPAPPRMVRPARAPRPLRAALCLE